MLTFVCWKWKRSKTGFQLPLDINYTAKHVNNLKNMIKRNISIPHRFLCLTDDPEGLECAHAPIPTKYAELGGCYRRLWMFSEEAKHVLGEKFVSIDLDCVIVRDITPLFDRDDTDFIANKYQGSHGSPDQYYNGGLMMHKAGTLTHVWNDFDETKIKELEKFTQAGKAIGSDQAWIRYKLGKEYPRWDNPDGVYEARQIHGEALPKNARLVLFAGKIDPSLDKREWIKRNWL